MTASTEGLPPRGITTRLVLAGVLAVVFGLRVWQLDQPIVENYVGRQVPTAMVARNLERGGAWLHPQIDTGPFPNEFLVEPPIYASVVAWTSRLSGLSIEESGRLVSALATTVGAWGLFGLIARREGEAVALVSVGVLASMPVMLRYGRAVQPDALMLGTQLAALRCWDAYVEGRRRGWLVAGLGLLATSLALKVTSVFILAPLIVVILGRERLGLRALAIFSIGPALLWYLHAAMVISEGEGSRASLDNGRIWLEALVPTALFEVETYRPVVCFLLLRLFTPIGLVLAIVGLSRRPIDRLWWVWGASAGLMLVALAAKWHHEYYWMVLAPIASLGVARALVALWRSGADGRRWAVGLGTSLVILSGLGSASTWRTPLEWQSLSEAAEAVQRHVPADALVVAPEALLFESDRRGCRLELPPRAAARAAGEWGGRLDSPGDPLALVEFYQAHGASYLADLGPESDLRRSALRSAVRSRFRVLEDRPGVFVAELTRRSPGTEGEIDVIR